MLTVDIAICTIDARISRVEQVLLPPAAGVGYVVSWQRLSAESQRAQVPVSLSSRSDVRVVCTGERGLSANRNNALLHARADIIVVADDDCRYTPAALAALRRCYEAHPEADVVCCRMTDLTGRPFRPYPSRPFRYPHVPYGHYFCSCEITLRRRAASVPFDPHFGLGAPLLGAGEEEVWLHDVHTRLPHAVILYEPLDLCATAPGTTGSLFLTSPSVQRARGALLAVVHRPIGALLRIVKTALTVQGASPVLRLRVLGQMLRGFVYAKRLGR